MNAGIIALQLTILLCAGSCTTMKLLHFTTKCVKSVKGVKGVSKVHIAKGLTKVGPLPVSVSHTLYTIHYMSSRYKVL